MAEFDDWIDKVHQWRDATDSVPSLVREDIMKSRYRPEKPERGFRAVFEDPMAVQYSLGYKDRKYSLTYDVLKQIVQNLSIISAIIQTRQNQIASFAVPFRASKSLGFVVKHKDPGKLTTKGEREMIKDLEEFIYNCGASEANPYNTRKRDDFETFLKKIVRDSLTFDAATFEVIPDLKGTPYEFMAVDASTIRFAANIAPYGPNNNWHNRSPVSSNEFHQKILSDPFSTMHMYSDLDQQPEYVQVINGQIEQAWTRDEFAFGVRNPRTDIYIHGYGYGELEQLITIITSHLYAEQYNRMFFQQGSAPAGILNFKGDAMTPDQLEAFRRQWRANLEGAENSWKTPIFQSEQGIDWINLKSSNRDMEYNSWLEYLLKITCGVFLIDPAELNFDVSGGVQQTPLFESSSEWKLKASRDRGLKPLLRFIAKLINDNVISKIDDHFMFDFVGLDELTEQEKHELRQEQVQSYKTLNEVRRADDLPDVDGGDMIMNPTYIQALQVRQQMEQAEQQMQGAGTQPQEDQGQAEQGQGEGEETEDQDKDVPEYSGTFTKSLNEDIIEIDLGDDYDEWFDLWRE